MTNRQLKRQKQGIYQRLIQQMRKDFSYLLKPRPFYLPFKTWVWLLDKLLYLDNDSIKNICSTSSLNAKTNNSKPTL